MKKLITLIFVLLLSIGLHAQIVIYLSAKDFQTKVFNYKVNKTWKYIGKSPCIVEFYATSSGPCKMIAPNLEQLAKKYYGKVIVYKVDTDQEKELTSSCGITSLPSLLYIPLKGQPQTSMGFTSLDVIEKSIHDVLQVK